MFPRTQDTRTAQVFGPPVFPKGKPPRRPDTWRRVQRRLMKETDVPSGYWDRKHRQYALRLEDFAKDFIGNGHIKEATQIYLVLYGKTQPPAVTKSVQTRAGLSPEEEARIEAEVTALSDGELAPFKDHPPDQTYFARMSLVAMALTSRSMMTWIIPPLAH